jgi:L-ascorbate metabolism protein UlaG (beta-lactamase superfamily)
VKFVLASLLLALGVICSLPAQAPPNVAKNGQVILRWLGTAGWEISDSSTVILIDPYVSRIIGPQPPGRTPFARTPGDTRPLYGWDDAAVADAAAIDAHVPRTDYVLVTHTH